MQLVHAKSSCSTYDMNGGSIVFHRDGILHSFLFLFCVIKFMRFNAFLNIAFWCNFYLKSVCTLARSKSNANTVLNFALLHRAHIEEISFFFGCTMSVALFVLR